ncbi:hypothetical protein GGR56DRAFT_500375 [Xylariaceae sp. FL0804]|nr:hypothetical protein GGR56DRAFT_500375 [Xylariaceae sp. FL0804]
MASDRRHGQFSRAGWRKRILLPCWIVQIGLLLGLLGLFAYRLSRTTRTWDDAETRGDVPMVEFVWEITNIAFSGICLIVTLVSIASFIAEAMDPLTLLLGSILSLVLSAAVLALDIVVYVQRDDKHYSLIGLGMDCVQMIFTLIPLVYSVIIYRRLAVYDDYHLTGHVKPFGHDGSDEAADDAMYDPTYLQPPTPYDPTTSSAYTPARPHSPSGGRQLSISLGQLEPQGSSSLSPPLPTTGATTPPAELQPQPQPQPKRASYDHKRDTSFDRFVNNRTRARSPSNPQALRDDVRRAMGAEFGWGGGPAAAEDDDDGRRRRSQVIGAAGRVSKTSSPPPALRQVSHQGSFHNAGAAAGPGPGSPRTTTSPGHSISISVTDMSDDVVGAPSAAVAASAGGGAGGGSGGGTAMGHSGLMSVPESSEEGGRHGGRGGGEAEG